MLWLGMHFPDLPLEVFMLREHDIETTCPRVVIEDNRVIRTNSAATTGGIRPGTSHATACSIAPRLQHYRRSRIQEQQRLRRLGEVLYAFSSQVSLEPPDGIVAEVGSSLRLFGDAESLARAAGELCNSLGHRCCHRLAETPLAALHLARTGSLSLSTTPLHAACADSFPGASPLTPALVEQLENMGLRTFGQLLELPADELAMRFGRQLVEYLQRVTGSSPDPRDYLLPAEHFRRQLHLLSPLRSKSALAGPMLQLSTELHHWLVARQYGTEALRWQFVAGGRQEQPVVMTVRFSKGQQQIARLLEVSRLELEHTTLPDEVISIGLKAENLRPLQGDSQALFRYLPPADNSALRSDHDKRRRRASRVNRATASGAEPVATSAAPLSSAQLAELGDLVDQLEARLGQGVCRGVRALDQRLPESAWQAVSPLATGSITRMRTERRRAASGSMSEAPGRPLWLFVPPQRIRMTQLTLLRGPERIEAEWWQEPTTGPRDYYVARHENGAECWVFIDANSQWYLHGYFG